MRHHLLVAALAAGMASLSACAGGVGGNVDVQKFPVSNARSELPTYTATFLCGSIPPDPRIPEFPQQPGELLVPGTYLTAINIINPNRTEIKFTKKARETLPQHEKERKPRFGEPQDEFLEPHQGLQVDCLDIWQLLGEWPLKMLREDFAKGFVVIESELPLDVVGVYSFKNVEVIH